MNARVLVLPPWSPTHLATRSPFSGRADHGDGLGLVTETTPQGSTRSSMQKGRRCGPFWLDGALSGMRTQHGSLRHARHTTHISPSALYDCRATVIDSSVPGAALMVMLQDRRSNPLSRRSVPCGYHNLDFE